MNKNSSRSYSIPLRLQRVGGIDCHQPTFKLAICIEGEVPIINTFKRILGVDTLLLGLALPNCAAHGPNENFPVENFEAGIRLNQALLEELS